jgi:hypothetical protein
VPSCATFPYISDLILSAFLFDFSLYIWPNTKRLTVWLFPIQYPSGLCVCHRNSWKECYFLDANKHHWQYLHDLLPKLKKKKIRIASSFANTIPIIIPSCQPNWTYPELIHHSLLWFFYAQFWSKIYTLSFLKNYQFLHLKLPPPFPYEICVISIDIYFAQFTIKHYHSQSFRLHNLISKAGDNCTYNYIYHI